MKPNSFSVVVPTHDRCELVGALLQTLVGARDCYTSDVEILIIDSTEGKNADVIRTLCTNAQARYFQCENNVCKKRNLGIHEAANEYVLFTDSDCEVPPDIFEQHAKAYGMDGESIGGVLGLTIVFGNKAPVWETLKLDRAFTSAFFYARLSEKAPWGTCTNLSFRRDILDQIGGFDNEWPLVVYGEDVDLGLRINKAGFDIKCNPSAVVKHNSINVSSYKQVFRKKVLCGKADYYLGEKHADHLAPEFPGWTAIAFLSLPIVLIRCFITRSIEPLFFCFLGLFLGIILQALLTALENKTGVKSVLRQSIVILFEASFEAGRMFAALRHGQIYRLWTKFVYGDRQLLGERKKRVQQIWGILLFLCILLIVSS